MIDNYRKIMYNMIEDKERISSNKYKKGEKKMKKRKDHAFGKDIYLLGKDEEGILYWLESAKWDCNWYWSIGHVETYTNNINPCKARDISSHQHFDNLFFNGLSNGFDNFKSFFSETPFNDNEIWKILEIIKSLYTLRKYSDMLHIGNSQYSSNPCKEIIKNEEEYQRINEVVIPTLNKELYKILSEEA